MKKKDFLKAVDQARINFQDIMINYNDLKGYLVLSSAYGQCELTGDPMKILKEFPAMISDSEAKDNVIKLIDSIRELENKNAARGAMNAEIQKKYEKTSQLLNFNLNSIEFKKDTYIEIRFKRPIMEMIFKMQKDPLVSQVHTQQSQSSIRIVLGTLIELAQRVETLSVNKNINK